MTDLYPVFERYVIQTTCANCGHIAKGETTVEAKDYGQLLRWAIHEVQSDRACHSPRHGEDEPRSGGCLWTAAMALFWLVVVIFAASRSPENVIPAGDTKGTVPQAPAPSGNLSRASEAPLASASSRPDLVGPGGASPSAPAAVHLPSPATQLSDGGAIEGGLATWCAPTPTQCQRWGGHALLGAVPSFRWGDPSYFVRVRYRGHQVVVRVVSYCACGHGKVIDLSPWAFRQLAPTWRGVIRVSVEWLR